jgi:hypothetical protein
MEGDERSPGAAQVDMRKDFVVPGVFVSRTATRLNRPGSHPEKPVDFRGRQFIIQFLPREFINLANLP